MPEYLHPGVYVQEESSGAKPIEAASTSTACFVGTAPRGQPNRPTFVTSWLQYERAFGVLDKRHHMPLAVRHFFENGGKRVYILRVLNANAKPASVTLTIDELTRPPDTEVPGDAGDPGEVIVKAKGGGEWGNSLRVRVRYSQFSRNTGTPPTNRNERRPILYDWRVEMETPARTWDVVEEFPGLGLEESGDKFYAPLINRDSQFIQIAPGANGFVGLYPKSEPTLQPKRPKENDDVIPWPEAFSRLGNGEDGGEVIAADYNASLIALDRIDDASILAIPGATKEVAMMGASYVEAKRPLGDMIYIVDSVGSPREERSATKQIEDVKVLLKEFSPKTSYAALYFPWVEVVDPYSTVSGAKRLAPPSGMIAGLYARTDNTRGVWKAPAGTEATLAGAVGVAAQVSDSDQDALNPIGINCVRQFPSAGIVVWGARTLSTQSNPEYRYVPVRRTAMFLKTSLYRGTQWVVFEPNDEPLWSSIRFNLDAFMLSLFRAGAFQGGKPADAYLVKCDGDTNIQATIDAGQVHIMVGFAPLKPAEFVIIHLQQIRKQ